MTTRTNDVSVTITGKDRLSPVLQNARKNMGRMQSSVVSMGSSMQALGSQTSGVLGPMVGLVGGMGALGVVVTGVGLGLSIGINKLKAWRAEQKKTAQSAEQFRNKLMLSGFSADNARSAVDELRGSLGRLAFQALPGLDFEMQGFIASMDAATETRFIGLVQQLIDMGVPAAAALAAIGEAMQGNFGPISKLLQRPISSFAEFAEAMHSLAVGAVVLETGVLKSLRALADGTADTTDKQLDALINIEKAFRENEGAIEGIRAQLTDTERRQLQSFFPMGKEKGSILRLAENVYRINVDSIIGHIDRASAGEEGYTAAVQLEHEARIKEIEKVSPVLAQAIRDAAREYGKDQFNLAVLRAVTKIEFDRIKAEQTGWVDSLETETQRAEGFLSRLTIALGQARATAAEIAAAQGASRVPSSSSAVPRPTPVAVPDPRVVPRPVPQPRQHGAVVMRPEIARIGEVPEAIVPLSRLPGLVGQIGGNGHTTVIVKIGERVIHDMVIEVLNDEVSLREPSLGLG